jgi:hypothetical protein
MATVKEHSPQILVLWSRTGHAFAAMPHILQVAIFPPFSGRDRNILLCLYGVMDSANGHSSIAPLYDAIILSVKGVIGGHYLLALPVAVSYSEHPIQKNRNGFSHAQNAT